MPNIVVKVFWACFFQSEALPKPTQSEENEQQTEEDMLAKEHELEVLRSLIYEEREEHGFKLPTEYGPHVITLQRIQFVGEVSS